MTRQALTNGKWFDIDGAECFGEETGWDGNNHISKATGSQWHHEDLYRTKGGKWILHSYGNFTEEWEEISSARATKWLVINEHEAPPSCAEEYAALEIR